VGQVLKEYWYLIAAGGLLLLTVVRLLIKYQAKKKEQKESYHKKLKNRALNEAIINSSRKDHTAEQKKVQQPVSFDEGVKHAENYRSENFVLRITVLGKTPEDYVVNPEKRIFIGRQPGMNDILLDGEMIASQHLELFRHERNVYVRTLYPDWQVFLKRKGNRTAISTRGIRVLSDDQIQLGKYRIKIELLDYTGMSR